MKYWVLTGLKNDKFLNHIKSCIESFQDIDFELVVVTHKDSNIKFDNAKVLKCEEFGIAPFFNTGLEYIKENCGPDDWFVRLDSDDYYGPNYLNNIESVRLLGAKATGIKDVYIGTEDMGLIFCQGMNDCSFGVPGGTLAGLVSESKYFRSVKPWDDDLNWCNDMSSAGINIVERDYRDFCLMRYPDNNHTFPITGKEFPHVWLCEAFNQGKWNINKIKNKAILNNIIPFNIEAAINIRNRFINM